MKKRLRSKVVWLSIIVQIILIVEFFNHGAVEPIKVVGTALVEILTLLGILNNPTDRDNF